MFREHRQTTVDEDQVGEFIKQLHEEGTAELDDFINGVEDGLDKPSRETTNGSEDKK